jgi:hypothetical protein
VIDWNEFAADQWDRAPTVLRGEALVGAADGYRLMQRAAAAFRAGEWAPLRFIVGRTPVGAELDAHLPRADEPSFAAYVARLERQLGGARFCTIVNEAQRYDAALADRLRAFTRPLLELIGAPDALAHAVLFAGDYEVTPLRVHKDRAHVFQHVLVGRKRMRTWPYEVFAPMARTLGDSNPFIDLEDYSAFLDRSRVVDGEPGDLIYWPEHHWHTGESVGGVTLALSWSIVVDPSGRPR